MNPARIGIFVSRAGPLSRESAKGERGPDTFRIGGFTEVRGRLRSHGQEIRRGPGDRLAPALRGAAGEWIDGRDPCRESRS